MKINMNVLKKTLILTLYLMCVSLTLVSPIGKSLLLFYTIFINVLLTIKYKNTHGIFIMMIFMNLYSIFLIPYFWFDVNISFYTHFQTAEYFTSTLIYHSAFIMSMYMFSKSISNKKLNIENNIKYHKSSVAFLVSLIMMVFIIVFGKTGSSILEVGGYGKASIGGFLNLAIYEYFYIFYIVGFVFSNDIKKRKKILLILAGIYSFKALLFGSRIEVIQMGLMLYVLHFEKKVMNAKRLSLYIILGYLFMEIFSVFRVNPAEFLSNMNNFELFKVSSDRGFISSNQGDVFYTSATFVGLIRENVFDALFRIKSFLGFVLQAFLPSKFIPIEAQLSNYIKLYTPSGGGGLVSIYFYVWGGLLGIILIAKYIVEVAKKTYITQNQYFRLYGIMVLSTYPRWFAYGPIVLFKLCLYIIPVYFLFKLFFSKTKYNDSL